jgi:hypothetical protein
VDARFLFDGMTMGKRFKGAVSTAAGCSEGINALPDSILHHILGFLEAQQAVQTTMLSRRWCHLWKSSSNLCIDMWKV